jgi:hypothetical protein
VKWDHKVASARLYELGISGDQYGHLVIRGVQKHRLNLVYRQTQNAQNVGLLEEKRAGENIWKYIKKHSGRKPELFGFLTAALIFGPHARDGKIVFPTPDFQPEIRSRANEINALKKSSGDYLDDHAKDEIKKREDTIAMIRKRTDFAGMLGSLGVPVAEGSREGYMTTTLNDILKGIERSWLDDTGATVYPLRTILNKLYTMQMQ